MDIKKHREIMVKILKDIYSDTSLGPLLGFKGGTAAYLFYGLDRFSVDLDFDLLDKEKQKEVYNKVLKIIEEYGKVKDNKNKEFTILFELSYSKESQNIKIEINKRETKAQFIAKNYLGISMLTAKKEDMLAYKLIALTNRKEVANRDIYDIYYFLKKRWEINEKIVERETKMKIEKYLKKCIKLLEGVNNKKILAGLGEVLDKKQKSRVKKSLLKDTIFQLKLRLNMIED